MPDENGEYTREEFQQTFGYDPVERMQKPVQPEVRGGWFDHLRSAAVGVGSIPTDLYGAIGTVGPAASALYNSVGTDKKFLDEFQRNMRVEGAQTNIDQHIQSIVDSWREQKPELTEDEINAGLDQYKKSKAFEDFTESQLRHMPRVAAQTKGAIREYLGDERPDSERSWTESAAEVLGGALVGGPGGWATGAGSAAARVGGITNRLVNNMAVRGALRTAEVLTPATIPYTPLNVGINAAAGLAIDQGSRYIQGKSTAFTPTRDDPAALGTLAATTGAIGATVAVLQAMRGRAHIALNANQGGSATGAALQQTPTLNAQTANPVQSGTGVITSGVPQATHTTPYLDTLAPNINAAWRAKNQYVSENIIPVNTIRDIHGSRVADAAEDIGDTSVGSVARDEIHATLAGISHDVDTSLAAMTPQRRRDAEVGMQMTSYYERWQGDIGDMNQRIAQMQQQIQGGRVTGGNLTALQNQHNRLVQRLNDVLADTDPNLRKMLPQTPMSEVSRLRNAFMQDTSPDIMRLKDALREQNRRRLSLDVAVGHKSQLQANAELAANPFYTPAMHDPLNGATGFTRMWRAVVNTYRNTERKAEEAGNTSVLREGSNDQLARGIPDPAHVAANPESRITSLLHSQSAQRQFYDSHLREAYNQRMRNHFSRRYLWDDAAQTRPTWFHSNGHARILHSQQGQTWFTPTQIHGRNATGDWLRQQLDNRRVSPEWQDGRMRLVEYGDIQIPAFLRQEPVIFDGMWKNVTRTTQMMKQMTTGYGNPGFAPVGAMYNTIMHMLFKRSNRVFGPVQTALAHVLPESVMKGVSRIPDPSVFATIPYHLLRNFWDEFNTRFARHIADTMANNNSFFSSFRNVVGPQNYQAMVQAAANRAARVHENAVVAQLRARGIGRNLGAVDSIHRVRDNFSHISDSVPQIFKSAINAYKDIIDLVYLTPQRMFYTENMSLLRRQYPNGIPPEVHRRLINETRFMGGNMHRTPASNGMKTIEGVVPYLTQTKLGAYELARNMGSRSTFAYVMPTAAMMVYGVGQSIYWRTYWNEESRQRYWSMPEHERYRRISIPTPKLLWAWFNGQNPNYSRDLFYDIVLPPDLVGITAGAASMMQMMGMLPNNVTPEPISKDFPKVFLFSLLPAMPPALQALFGYNSMKLDPESADTHAGNIVRQIGATYRSGPQAEAASNLGQVSNATSLVLSALLGTFGSHIAAGTDVMLHASKYYPPGKDGKLTPREERDFAAGLRAATSTVFERAVKNIPDVPLLWQNKERYSVMTPQWQFVAESTPHIRSIVGIKDTAAGKEAEIQRKYAGGAGGIPKEALQDVVLIQVAQAVAQFQNPTGPLGKLKKEYRGYGAMSSGISSAYNMPAEEKSRRLNNVIQKQQENMEQQHLAIKYMEQRIAAKYGKYLAPLLQGRKVNVATLDQLMRERIGVPNPDAVYSQAGAATEE